MSVTKIRLNRAGVKAILNSQAVDKDLRARAERTLAALPTGNGEKWEIVRLQGDRVSYMIRAANYEARRRAASDPVLQRALGAARG